MFDQVDVAFSEDAPIIAELSVLRVSDLYWNLGIGGLLCRIASFIGASISIPASTEALRIVYWAWSARWIFS
jgi:hypothetical protein